MYAHAWYLPECNIGYTNSPKVRSNITRCCREGQISIFLIFQPPFFILFFSSHANHWLLFMSPCSYYDSRTFLFSRDKLISILRLFTSPSFLDLYRHQTRLHCRNNILWDSYPAPLLLAIQSSRQSRLPS